MASYGTVASNFPWLIQPNPGEYALAARRNAIASQANFLRGVQMRQQDRQFKDSMDMRKKELEAQELVNTTKAQTDQIKALEDFAKQKLESDKYERSVRLQTEWMTNMQGFETYEDGLEFLSKNAHYAADPATSKMVDQFITTGQKLEEFKSKTTQEKLRVQNEEELLELYKGGYLEGDPSTITPDQKQSARTRYASDRFRELATEYGVNLDEVDLPLPTRPNGQFNESQAKQLLAQKAPFDPESTEGKLLKDARELRKTGIPEDIAMSNQLLSGLNEKLKGTGTFLEIDGEGNVKFASGTGASGIMGDPTVSNRTKLQETIARNYDGADILANLYPKITPDIVGIKGLVGEVVIDRGLEQFFPGMASGSRVNGRTLIRSVRETLLKTISSDTRFSNIDRAFIEQILPEDGAMTSVAVAQGQIRTVMELFKRRARNAAEALGNPVPDFTLSKYELAEKIRNGEMTDDEAAEIASRFIFPDE